MELERKILLETPPGKNDSLRFYGERPELYDRIKSFLHYHNCHFDAEHYDVVKRSGYFVQSDHSDFLMLEFWSVPERYMPTVKLLAEHFDLDYKDIREKK